MRVALRKQDCVARSQPNRLAVAHVDEAFAFGDEMEDHDPLGARLEDRRRHVGRWRLIAPGRGEARVDEDGTDQMDDTQGFRKCVHR